MVKTRSMTRDQNHDDDASSSSSTTKRFKIVENIGVSHWSNLGHDVIFLVMMKLGAVDFVSFSGVCKSWRSLALSNWNMFMASKPPMEICSRARNQDSYWYLKDFVGRKFKTMIPYSNDRICFGLTSGYLVLFGWETRDFWLVNPITRHELHFPNFPLDECTREVSIRAILVFSPSISGWVFVVLCRKVWCIRESKPEISYYIAGKRGWSHVSSSVLIFDLHAFKGKIYTLHTDFSVCELRLDPNQLLKWTLLETKNFPKPDLEYPELTSSGENLYVMNRYCSLKNKGWELDFGEMKWVSAEKTIQEYAFFLSNKKSSAAIKPESWAGLQTQYKSYDCFLDNQQHIPYYKWIWYFPHDCLNFKLLDG